MKSSMQYQSCPSSWFFKILVGGSRKQFLGAVLLFMSIAVHMPAVANAGVILTIDATDSGWYRSDFVHIPSNESFLTGRLGSEHRGFLVFDISGVTAPIISAFLRLDAGAVASGVGEETVEFVEVTSPAATVIAGGSNQAVYDDLVDGTVFATRTITLAEANTDIDIALNASAVAALNGASGDYVFGAHSLTIDPALTSDYAFGGSPGTRQLVIEVIPEPRTILLVAVSGMGLLASRRSRTATKTR